jgi:hypothetical protein
MQIRKNFALIKAKVLKAAGKLLCFKAVPL